MIQVGLGHTERGDGEGKREERLGAQWQWRQPGNFESRKTGKGDSGSKGELNGREEIGRKDRKKGIRRKMRGYRHHPRFVR